MPGRGSLEASAIHGSASGARAAYAAGGPEPASIVSATCLTGEGRTEADPSARISVGVAAGTKKSGGPKAAAWNLVSTFDQSLIVPAMNTLRPSGS
jgi:hypothetical protein